MQRSNSKAADQQPSGPTAGSHVLDISTLQSPRGTLQQPPRLPARYQHGPGRSQGTGRFTIPKKTGRFGSIAYCLLSEPSQCSSWFPIFLVRSAVRSDPNN